MRHLLTATRRLRLSALALAITAFAGCGDDATGPASVSPGTYTLTSVQTLQNFGGGGAGLPVTFVDGAGKSLKFNSGSLALETDGSFDLTVNVVFGASSYDAGDLGIYNTSGRNVSFVSELDDSSFTGTVDGSRLKVKYSVAGAQFELTLMKS